MQISVKKKPKIKIYRKKKAFSNYSGHKHVLCPEKLKCYKLEKAYNHGLCCERERTHMTVFKGRHWIEIFLMKQSS